LAEHDVKSLALMAHDLWSYDKIYVYIYICIGVCTVHGIWSIWYMILIEIIWYDIHDIHYRHTHTHIYIYRDSTMICIYIHI
jgi:hypothetical protein